MPQPNLVPGRPATSRTAQSSGMLGSASNVVGLPLRSNEVDINASAEGRDNLAVDSKTSIAPSDENSLFPQGRTPSGGLGPRPNLRCALANPPGGRPRRR